jgi:flagellar biosynthesis activator protein FlaF
MIKSVYQVYDNMSKETMTGREIEAHILTKAANKLKLCQSTWNSSGKAETLKDALAFNQKIWNLLQAELSRGDHPLPKKLRQDILNLSIFIDRRSFEIMAHPDLDKLTALININLNIASGLRGSV